MLLTLLGLHALAFVGYSDTMTDLQWEAPPAPRGARTEFFKRLAARLRERPGAWAVAAEGLSEYRTQAAVLASRIKTGKLTAFRPAGEFEATSAKDKETGDTRVYARYVGPGAIYRDFQETGREAPPLSS